MPAAVPHTSTFALTNATLPYLQLLADLGLDRAVDASPALREGVNTYRGELIHPGVAESQGLPWHDLATASGLASR
jgi:alanine dehydrogenase